MKKKNGFVFIETMIVVVTVLFSLLVVYSSYTGIIRIQRKRVRYDDPAFIYKTYVIGKFLTSLYDSDGTTVLSKKIGASSIKFQVRNIPATSVKKYNVNIQVTKNDYGSGITYVLYKNGKFEKTGAVPSTGVSTAILSNQQLQAGRVDNYRIEFEGTNGTKQFEAKAVISDGTSYTTGETEYYQVYPANDDGGWFDAESGTGNDRRKSFFNNAANKFNAQNILLINNKTIVKLTKGANSSFPAELLNYIITIDTSDVPSGQTRYYLVAEYAEKMNGQPCNPDQLASNQTNSSGDVKRDENACTFFYSNVRIEE